jgi:hypothetical protein
MDSCGVSSAGRLSQALQRAHVRLGFDSAGRRGPQGGHPGHVRLAAPDEGAVHEVHANAVGRRARGQRLERRDLGGVPGDDQLAASIVWHPVPGRKRKEAVPAFNAERGFQ